MHPPALLPASQEEKAAEDLLGFALDNADRQLSEGEKAELMAEQQRAFDQMQERQQREGRFEEAQIDLVSPGSLTEEDSVTAEAQRLARGGLPAEDLPSQESSSSSADAVTDQDLQAAVDAMNEGHTYT